MTTKSKTNNPYIKTQLLSQRFLAAFGAMGFAVLVAAGCQSTNLDPADLQPQNAKQKSTLIVEVVDALDGTTPVTNATVTLYATAKAESLAPGFVPTAIDPSGVVVAVDENGIARFEDATASQWLVEATAPGYEQARRVSAQELAALGQFGEFDDAIGSGSATPKGETVGLAKVYMRPKIGTISGFVMIKANRPATDVTVELVPWLSGLWSFIGTVYIEESLDAQITRTQTDTNGFYQFADVPAGRYAVRVPPVTIDGGHLRDELSRPIVIPAQPETELFGFLDVTTETNPQQVNLVLGLGEETGIRWSNICNHLKAIDYEFYFVDPVLDGGFFSFNFLTPSAQMLDLTQCASGRLVVDPDIKPELLVTSGVKPETVRLRLIDPKGSQVDGLVTVGATGNIVFSPSAPLTPSQHANDVYTLLVEGLEFIDGTVVVDSFGPSKPISIEFLVFGGFPILQAANPTLFLDATTPGGPEVSFVADAGAVYMLNGRGEPIRRMSFNPEDISGDPLAGLDFIWQVPGAPEYSLNHWEIWGRQLGPDVENTQMKGQLFPSSLDASDFSVPAEFTDFLPNVPNVAYAANTFNFGEFESLLLGDLNTFPLIGPGNEFEILGRGQQVQFQALGVDKAGNRAPWIDNNGIFTIRDTYPPQSYNGVFFAPLQDIANLNPNFNVTFNPSYEFGNIVNHEMGFIFQENVDPTSLPSSADFLANISFTGPLLTPNRLEEGLFVEPASFAAFGIAPLTPYNVGSTVKTKGFYFNVKPAVSSVVQNSGGGSSAVLTLVSNSHLFRVGAPATVVERATGSDDPWVVTDTLIGNRIEGVNTVDDVVVLNQAITDADPAGTERELRHTWTMVTNTIQESFSTGESDIRVVDASKLAEGLIVAFINNGQLVGPGTPHTIISIDLTTDEITINPQLGANENLSPGTQIVPVELVADAFFHPLQTEYRFRGGSQIITSDPVAVEANTTSDAIGVTLTPAVQAINLLANVLSYPDPLMVDDLIAFDVDGLDLDLDFLGDVRALYFGSFTIADRRLARVISVANVDSSGIAVAGETDLTDGIMEGAEITLRLADGGDTLVLQTGPSDPLTAPEDHFSALSSGDALILGDAVTFQDTSGNVGPTAPYRILVPSFMDFDPSPFGVEYLLYQPLGGVLP